MLAGVCCVLIGLLAAAPGVRAQGGDSVSLLFVALSGAVVLLSPLRNIFFPADERDEPRARNAATFALLCAMSVLFPLARYYHYAPFAHLGLHFSWADNPFPISLAAVIAVVGALLTWPSTMRLGSGVVRASVLTLAIVAIMGVGSFWFLGRFYQVSPTAEVDPTPLVYLLQQIVEWGALVLLCRAASSHPRGRRMVLGAMIVVLLLVWARQHTLPPPVQEQ